MEARVRVLDDGPCLLHIFTYLLPVPLLTSSDFLFTILTLLFVAFTPIILIFVVELDPNSNPFVLTLTADCKTV